MRKIILILIAFGFLSTASFVFGAGSHPCHDGEGYDPDCKQCGDIMGVDLSE